MLRLLQAIGQLQIGILVGWLLRLLCPRCGDTDKQEPPAIDEAPISPWDTAWAAAYEPYGAGEITIIDKGKKKDDVEVVAAKQAVIEARKDVDEAILANLLRLNQQRASES